MSRDRPRRVRARALLSALLAACAPQVVDAVDRVETAGSDGSGGSANSGGTAGRSGGGTAACSDLTPCACDPNIDRDGDGTPDCDDGCPDQPTKIAPGLCGCELPDDDASEPGVASCQGLVDTLVRRYAFNGTGTAVRDSMGGPDGSIVGSALTGAGAVTLEGRMTGEFVDLPNGALSTLDSATVEVWLTWYGGAEWQRIFDIGDDQTGVEGAQGSGSSYLFLTPRITDDGGRLVRVAYQRTSYPEVQLDATRTLPTGTLTHVAVTVDAASETLALYLDGALENSKSMLDAPIRLSVINDINVWLGRSQYAADPDLSASIEEFRIYSTALSAAQVRSSFAAGPSPSFLPP